MVDFLLFSSRWCWSASFYFLFYYLSFWVLSSGKHLIFLEEVEIVLWSSVLGIDSTLPWIGSNGLVFLTSVFPVPPFCSRKPPAELLCPSWPSHLYQAVQRVVEGGWGVASWCVQAFSLCGFSHTEYRPLRLEGFFSPFAICRVRILLPGGHGECSRRVPVSAEGICWWWALEHCHLLHHFSAPDCGPRFNVCQPPMLDNCLCPSHLPSGGRTLTLHSYHVHWATASTRLRWLLSLFSPRLLRYSHLEMSPWVKIFCWIVGVQLVVNLSGETWRSSHTTILLMSHSEGVLLSNF